MNKIKNQIPRIGLDWIGWRLIVTLKVRAVRIYVYACMVHSWMYSLRYSILVPCTVFCSIWFYSCSVLFLAWFIAWSVHPFIGHPSIHRSIDRYAGRKGLEGKAGETLKPRRRWRRSEGKYVNTSLHVHSYQRPALPTYQPNHPRPLTAYLSTSQGTSLATYLHTTITTTQIPHFKTTGNLIGTIPRPYPYQVMHIPHHPPLNPKSLARWLCWKDLIKRDWVGGGEAGGGGARVEVEGGRAGGSQIH